MTTSDKLLYQQIHPAKLIVDFGTSFASSWLLWEAQWAYAIVVACVPSIVIRAGGRTATAGRAQLKT